MAAEQRACSAAVLGCEFKHRPGAWGRDGRRDAASTRRRGRPRYVIPPIPMPKASFTTTTQSLGALLKSARDIMRIDKGLRINAVSSATTRFVVMSAVKYVEVADGVAEQFVIPDDVFMVRYNGDINGVAKPAIYRGTSEARAIYPDKLMRLRPKAARMTPDFLVFAFSSRRVRTQIEVLGETAAGNVGVSGADAQSFVVPVPPLPEQRRIVAELNALQAEVDVLKRLQAETAAELDALLPAILDRAFKGEV
jgi:hypothetical protein